MIVFKTHTCKLGVSNARIRKTMAEKYQDGLQEERYVGDNTVSGRLYKEKQAAKTQRQLFAEKKKKQPKKKLKYKQDKMAKPIQYKVNKKFIPYL